MKRLSLILEGRGDVDAAPTLISRAANVFGHHIFASSPPIRCGGALRLAREGELERFLVLAASRPDADEILLLLDLDDGCAAKLAANFNARAAAIADRLCKPVHVCFCIREYEAWFLAGIRALRVGLPDYGIDPEVVFNNPEGIRGAKEALRGACRLKGYKPMRDQLRFTQKLDIRQLAISSRSFRKLLKSILDRPCDEILRDCGTESLTTKGACGL